ncbi:polysaccharide deacetylase family protein [Lysinibacillus sp. FSL M8-0216]|uniref:polysaccharide deacetylase family protein n=1 Tax=Lysinibacillus sp. FSL M8-0216 TaxID=2921619 RepID=UPI00315A9551
MKRPIVFLILMCSIIFSNSSIAFGSGNDKIPILMYHHLKKSLNNNVVISPDNFENQIKTLKEAGYNSISIQQLFDYLNENKLLPQNPVLITFDDGYLSNYELAYPILKKYNMHAEIFVIVSQILENNEIKSNTNEIPKMTWEQLREMRDTFTIQSHTWNSHNKLVLGNGKLSGAVYGPSYIKGTLETKKMYEERVISDFIRSKEVIKAKLGYEPIAISYPFGIVSNEAIKLAEAAGFKLGFVINNKSIVKDDNPFTLSRITVNGNDTGIELLEKIKNS